MIIGTPKEVKANETRVAMTPCWAKKLVKAGHEIWMQKGAGLNAGFADSDYVSVGAKKFFAERILSQRSRNSSTRNSI